MYAISMSIDGAQEKHPVKIVSLDDLLDSLSIQQVDIMKIDVEGFELNVLKGLKRRISRKLINVIVSRGLYEMYAISKSNKYGQL